MPSIKDLTIHDLLPALPEWVAGDALPTAALFIGAVGFEERASDCFVRWCSQGASDGARAILITYPSSDDSHAERMAPFLAAAERAAVPLDLVEYDRRSLFWEVRKRLVDETADILLDISALASFVFYPLLSAVFDAAHAGEVFVCYAEAVEYFPKKEEWEGFQQRMADLDRLQRARLFDEAHFQSRGVDHVFEVVTFPGSNIDTLPTSAVLIPNFSFERISRMEEYAVDKYGAARERAEWIIGMPPDQLRNGWRHDALCQMYDRAGTRHSACTMNYKDIVLVLHSIWEKKHDSEFLVLAPLGSKAQHLGIFVFLQMHPEIAIIVSEPSSFNSKRYSSGVGQRFALSLGRVLALRQRLSGWNQAVFEWDAS